jgi:hypothetical protein
MGVISCERNGCTNIMCNRHSNLYGDICDECYNELLERIDIDINAFMASRKENNNMHNNAKRLWEDYLDAEFEDRNMLKE